MGSMNAPVILCSFHRTEFLVVQTLKRIIKRAEMLIAFVIDQKIVADICGPSPMKKNPTRMT